jgi:hypothetical protein
LLDHFLGTGNAFPGEPGMNRAKQIFADGSFRERQEQSFLDRIGRPLRGGIELTDGLDFIAEELNSQRAIRFRRVNVQNPAAQRVLARHFDHIRREVADCIEMAQQRIDVDGFAAPYGSRQISIVFRRTQAQGHSRNRRDQNRDRSGGNLPKRNRAFLLNFGMRR